MTHNQDIGLRITFDPQLGREIARLREVSDKAINADGSLGEPELFNHYSRSLTSQYRRSTTSDVP